ncbi:MAG TPA: hypothetical protein VJA21_17840, partial [Verrucomicrobiae bacterium]
ETSAGSVLNPKLIGCYEAELHPFIEAAIGRHHTTIIDIGCAEGYYAVGLLFRLKHARAIAFDLDPRAQQLCRDLAALNAVSDRLSVLGRCTPASLAAALSPIQGRAGSPSTPPGRASSPSAPPCLPSTFILSDCEAAELDLLDPAAVPALAHCDLLVELHDFLRPGTAEILQTRFAPTHTAQLIDQQPRDADRFPQIRHLSKEDRRRAVHEFRPAPMQWLMLTPQPGFS